jgi:hypothetical protein
LEITVETVSRKLSIRDILPPNSALASIGSTISPGRQRRTKYISVPTSSPPSAGAITMVAAAIPTPSLR